VRRAQLKFNFHLYAQIDKAYKEFCRIYSKVKVYNLKLAYAEFFKSADPEFYYKNYGTSKSSEKSDN
jgi:hypothetical protein